MPGIKVPFVIWTNETRHRSGFWQNKYNQQKYIEWLGKQLGITKMDMWYDVTCSDFGKYKGVGMLALYRGSSSAALMSVYNTHAWEPWRFTQPPQGYWKDKNNHRKCMDWVYNHLGYKKLDDWYNITYAMSKFVGRLLEHYNFSLIQAIMHVYSEHEWEPWKFAHVSQGFWDSPTNHKLFVEWLGKKLNFSKMSDWYSIKASDFSSHKGAMVMKHYHDSPSTTIMKVLNDHQWEPWRFENVRTHVYDENEAKVFTHFLEHELQINSITDWYNISVRILGSISKVPFTKRWNGLAGLLAIVYPSNEWEVLKFSTLYKKSQQNLLLRQVCKMLPNYEILQQYSHPLLQYSASKENIQFDIFIPALNLAFEYQGVQHYSKPTFGAVLPIIKRDVEKKQICERAKIKLVVVPYWWDMRRDTLATLIQQALHSHPITLMQ